MVVDQENAVAAFFLRKTYRHEDQLRGIEYLEAVTPFASYRVLQTTDSSELGEETTWATAERQRERSVAGFTGICRTCRV